MHPPVRHSSVNNTIHHWLPDNRLSSIHLYRNNTTDRLCIPSSILYNFHLHDDTTNGLKFWPTELLSVSDSDYCSGCRSDHFSGHLSSVPVPTLHRRLHNNLRSRCLLPSFHLHQNSSSCFLPRSSSYLLLLHWCSCNTMCQKVSASPLPSSRLYQNNTTDFQSVPSSILYNFHLHGDTTSGLKYWSIYLPVFLFPEPKLHRHLHNNLRSRYLLPLFHQTSDNTRYFLISASPSALVRWKGSYSTMYFQFSPMPLPSLHRTSDNILSHSDPAILSALPH